MFNRKSMGAIAASICLGLLSVKGQVNPDLPEKGQIKSVVTLPVPNVSTVKSLYNAGSFNSWELGKFKSAKSGVGTGQYKSNANLQAVSGSIQLPQLTEDEQLYLNVTDEFSLESYYDLGKILVSKDGGVSWKSVYTVSGQTARRTAWINLSSYGGQTIQLALSFASDGSFESTGWVIHELSIAKGNLEAPVTNARLQSTKEIKITGINTSNFPEYVYVDFEYTENGVLQPTALSINDLNLDAFKTGTTAIPDLGNCDMRLFVDNTKRQVDVVFLIDNSGSMSDEQQQIKDNINDFVTAIGPGNDVAFGMLRFGQAGPPIEKLELLPGTKGLPTDNFTKEVPYYQGEIQARNVVDGYQERGYEALKLALTANFRPAAQKVFILVTDENTTDPTNMGPTTKAQVISELLAKNAVVYSWIPTDADYNATYADVSSQTGGKRYDISQPITGVINDIAASLKGTYTLRYCPLYKTVDATVHSAQISLKADQTVFDVKTWVAAPNQEYIIREPSTADKDKIALPETTATSDYCFYVYDNTSPYPTSAQLFVKPISSTGAYTAVNMVQSTAPAPYVQKWCGTVPPSTILRPGFAYYAVATYADGHQLKSPPTQEDFFAWNQAVQPNYPPIITILAATPTSVPSCSPVNIQFTVSDNTNNYTKVTLYYREKGSLSAYIPVDIYTYLGSPAVAPTSGSYSPSLTVTGTGLEYYIIAYDSWGIMGASGDPNKPLTITGTPKTVNTNTTNRMTLTFSYPTLIKCTPLQVGDIISVDYEDNCKTLASAGQFIVTNANIAQSFYIYGNTAVSPGKNGLDAGEILNVKITRGTEVFLVDVPPSNSPIATYTQGGNLTWTNASITPTTTLVPRFSGYAIPDGDVNPSTLKGTKFDVNYGQSVTRSYTISKSGCGGVFFFGILVDDPQFFEVNITDYVTGSFTITYNAFNNIQNRTMVTILSNTAPKTFMVEGNALSCTKSLTYNSVLIPDGDPSPSVSEGTDFGTVTAQLTRNFIISGASCSPTLAITSVTSSNPADFTATYSGNTISVKYNALADASGVITVSTNAGDYTFSVVGKRPACAIVLKYGIVTVPNNDSSPSTGEGTDFGVTTTPLTRNFTLGPNTCTPVPTITSAFSNDPAFTVSYSGSNLSVTYTASADAVGTITLNTNHGTSYSFDVIGSKTNNCAIKDFPGSNIISQYGAQVKIKLNTGTATGYTVAVSGQFIRLADGAVMQTYATNNYGTSYPYWENYIGNGGTLPIGTYRLRLQVSGNGTCSGTYNFDFVVQ